MSCAPCCCRGPSPAWSGFCRCRAANYTLTENTAGGIGFTAITVAWLAKLNPVVMVFIAALLAVFCKRARGASRPSSSSRPRRAEVLTGIILFFMLGCEFFHQLPSGICGEGSGRHGQSDSILLVAAVLAGTPLLFGTLGEILTEKSGNLNLGVEGIMFMGGVAGLAGAYYYERAAQSSLGRAGAADRGRMRLFVRRVRVR